MFANLPQRDRDWRRRKQAAYLARRAFMRAFIHGAPMIAKTTAMWINADMTYATVEWIDSTGKAGATSGDVRNSHMQALIARARRENATVKGHHD